MFFELFARTGAKKRGPELGPSLTNTVRPIGGRSERALADAHRREGGQKGVRVDSVFPPQSEGDADELHARVTAQHLGEGCGFAPKRGLEIPCSCSLSPSLSPLPPPSPSLPPLTRLHCACTHNFKHCLSVTRR